MPYNANKVVKGSNIVDPSRFSHDHAFIGRIMVNCLRHQATVHDDSLRDLFGKVGQDDACMLLKVKIYDSIAEAHPELVLSDR